MVILGVGVNLKEVEVTVPAKSRKRAKMIGKMSNVDLPYEAKVRLTYDDGTERIVTDIGKWRGVFVSDFKKTLFYWQCMKAKKILPSGTICVTKSIVT